MSYFNDVPSCLIVEIRKKPAGLLARVDGKVQFFASSESAFALNRRTFSSVAEAINAVAHAVGQHRSTSGKLGAEGRQRKASPGMLTLVGS